MYNYKSAERRRFNDYDKDKLLAKDILNRIGVVERVHSYNISFGGGFYEQLTYEGYGLKIISSKYDGLCIIFNGEVVFRYDVHLRNNEYYNDEIYIPGPWEEILDVLQNRVGFIENQMRQEEVNKKRANRVLDCLIYIGGCIINHELRVEEEAKYIGADNDIFDGAQYRVFNEDKLVLNAYVGNNNERNIYSFEPGNWENDIRRHAEYVEHDREEKKKQLEQEIANENIRKLYLLK